MIICGKTGTIQNPHGAAHSAFVAFAPKINPKIAVAVYIENGVWGARYGAPIASLIIEKYLKGRIAPARQHFEDAMMMFFTNSNSIVFYFNNNKCVGDGGMDSYVWIVDILAMVLISV